MKLQNIRLKNQSTMFRFTENEIRSLQVGKPMGPFLATRREIHKAQANLCNYKAKYPGAEFKNKSTPHKREQPDGKVTKVPGWYMFTIERLSYGVDADTGQPEM